MKTSRRSFFGVLAGILGLPLLARAEKSQTTMPTEPGWYWFTGGFQLPKAIIHIFGAEPGSHHTVDNPVHVTEYQNKLKVMVKASNGSYYWMDVPDLEGTWTKIEKPV